MTWAMPGQLDVYADDRLIGLLEPEYSEDGSRITGWRGCLARYSFARFTPFFDSPDEAIDALVQADAE